MRSGLRWVWAGACAAAIGVLPQAAAASFRVCNESSYTASVAYGYRDGDSWAAQGWRTVEPGECQVLVRGNLTERFYYIYATHENGEWGPRRGQSGGGFCISMRRFMYRNEDFLAANGRDIACRGQGVRFQQFLEIDTGDAVNWTHRLLD